MKLSFFQISLFVIALSFQQLIAQDLTEYSWGTVAYKSQDKKYSANDQVYIKRLQKIELSFDDKAQSFDKTLMNHFIIQINTEKGLKIRKELEPPVESDAQKVLEFKARIIHPDGTTYEFKKSDLKEKKESEREKLDEDGETLEENDEEEEKHEDEEDETYTYYDLSDLKVGSQLEFFMIIQSENPSMSGSLFNYQSRIPIQDFSFELNANKEFSFLFKSYNGCPEVIRDSTNKVRTIYQINDRMVDAFPKEKFSNYGANIRGFIYKLDGYELGKKKNIYNNEDFSRNLYNYTYTLDKKELSTVKKVLKQSKAKSFKTEDEQIMALENYLKSTFQIYNISGLNFLFNIENLYQYNAITGENAARIMANALNMLKIEHELIMGCSRFDYRYDKDFQTNFFMDRFLFFFPSSKKYLDPNSSEFRLGVIPGDVTHNNALFIRSVTAGGVTSGIGKVKFIEALGKDASKDVLEIKVSFAENLESAFVDLKRTMSGYFAADWQPFFRKFDAEQRVEYEKALFRFIDEDMTVSKAEYLNVEKSDINRKPFVVVGNGESQALISSKSDTLVFKIGKLIGEQADLFDDEQRILPIERASARTYQRQLEIDLPPNYSISNIGDLNMSFELKNDKGEKAAVFNSSYVLNGNKLTVTIEEWFEDIILPADKYKEFRDVINASASFYKLELLLTK